MRPPQLGTTGRGRAGPAIQSPQWCWCPGLGPHQSLVTLCVLGRNLSVVLQGKKQFLSTQTPGGGVIYALQTGT